MKSYLFELPGKNSWMRYLSSFVLIIASFLIFSAIFVYLPFQLIYSEKNIEKLDPLPFFLMSNLTFLVLLISIYVFVRIIHKRNFKTLITWRNQLDWTRVFWGFFVLLGLITVSSIISFVANPNSMELNQFTLRDLTYLMLIVVFLVPIQTTVEEVFFRGYLIQFFSKKIKNQIFLSMIIAVIFGSLHFVNPEMKQSAILVGIDYIFVGFILTLIAVKTGTLEYSIGGHAANNMFLFLIFSDKSAIGGALPAPIIVLDHQPMLSVLLDIVMMIAFFYFCYKKNKQSISPIGE